jgi:hypothetical protein
MWFEAPFIVDTSGILNENAAGFWVFFSPPLGQNINFAKLSSSWQDHLNLSRVSSIIIVPVPTWPTNRKGLFSSIFQVMLSK